MRRIAAFAAAFAFALNLAVGSLASTAPLQFDAFGQPICSEHAVNPELPSAPADSAQCQLCCVLAVADAVSAPVLPLPSTVEWKRPAPIGSALSLPPPSRHRTGPPRAPPIA
jgi:hypothetical protein